MSSLDNIVARLGQATAQAEEATAAYKGAIMNVGYKLYRAFEAAVTLTQVNDAVQFSVGGIFYRWDGVFPQGGLVIPQNTPEPSPDQTGAGKYIAVLDLDVASRVVKLETDLAGPDGYAKVGTPGPKGSALRDSVYIHLAGVSDARTLAGPYPTGIYVKSTNAVYKWVVGATDTDNGITVLAPNGVSAGRWIMDSSYQRPKIPTIADLRRYPPTVSPEVEVRAHRSGFNYGGGVFVWDSASKADDNNGTVIAVSGVVNGRWVRIGYDALNAAMFGLPKEGDCLAELKAIEAIQYATGMDCYFNIDGVYGTIGEVNWPWRQEAVPAASFKDYKGARLICKGPGVVFKTTSATGADILQLNSICNFSVIGWPTLTATLTASADAGSNGVSVTNGGKNIYCEVEAKDLPFTVKSNYLDGGKAITLQNGAGTLLPYQNVKLICRRAENCAYGATADIATQPLVAQQNWYGNLLDVTAIDCYRAAQVSADSPTEGTVPSNGLNMGLDMVVDAINCQQDYVESRGWCVNTKVRTQRNKGTAGLIGKNPNDHQLFVDNTQASNGGSLNVDGSVTSVDYLHAVGGLITTNGNSATKFKDFRYAVRYQGALSSPNQVRIIDAGGSTVTGCTFNIFGTTGFAPDPLVAAKNSVVVNGVVALKGTVTP